MGIPRPWTNGLRRILPRPPHSVRRWCRRITYRGKYVGVGTLASSQEQRALLVPRISRLSTADRPRVFVPPSVYMRFPLFVLPKRRPQLFWFASGSGGQFFPGRTDPSASRSARPCPSRHYAVHAVPHRPTRGMLGFWIRQVRPIFHLEDRLVDRDRLPTRRTTQFYSISASI